MEIAIISYWSCPLTRVGVFRAGGMNIYVSNLMNMLGKMGHRIDVFTRTHTEEDISISEIQKNVRIIHLKSKKSNNIDYFTSELLNFIRSQQKKYDLIHAHYYYSGIVGIKLKNKLDIPLISTFHTLEKIKANSNGVEDHERIKKEMLVIQKSSGIVTSTEFEKDAIINIYGGSSEKIFIVPPGVNHFLFKPRNQIYSKDKLGLPINKKIILFVGRIDPIKGISLLIESIGKLKKVYPEFTNEVQVLIIGGDIENTKFWEKDEVRRINNVVKREKLESCVRFIGSKAHTILPFYYSAATVVVMPSYYESFGLVVLEALASGATVLASKAGGLKILIKDKKNGRLFKKGDVSDLMRVLWELLNDSKQRAYLQKNAIDSTKKYCWKIETEKMIKVYNIFIRKNNG